MEARGVRRGRVGVILDTNFLVVPFRFGVDIFDEIHRILPGADLFVLSGTLDEVRRNLSMYRVAIEKMLAANNVGVIESGEVDPCLVELAKRGFVIATNDRELRRKIKRAGGRVVYLRGLKKLQLE